ncbi:hypothetical protein ACFRMQ_11190 [Kitasatospora sp. NPDC056783]|uniref:hypothetical protein n=1 Tax=Kitasatospora sp. NPDC056783 TaxID=3345943 RepID=UPI00367F89DB
MSTRYETPPAVDNYLGARRALIDAMRADQKGGVSANDIARMAMAAWSRPITLDYLKTWELRDDVQTLIEQAGLKSYVDVAATGAASGAREVRLIIVCDPVETPPEEWAGLPGRIGELLAASEITWAFPEGEELPLTALLDDQEYVLLARA